MEPDNNLRSSLRTSASTEPHAHVEVDNEMQGPVSPDPVEAATEDVELETIPPHKSATPVLAASGVVNDEPAAKKKGIVTKIKSIGKRKQWKHYPLVAVNDAEENAHKHFPHNRQRTAKYTLLTFLPKNLFEQFRHVHNIYFLSLVVIVLIPRLSPLNPITAILPLAFVLVVSAVREAFEDYRRYKADKAANERKYTVVNPDGSTEQVASESLKVGSIVRLEDGEQIPADLVLLWTALEEGLCYVDTAQLDGETNLKELRALDATFRLPEDAVYRMKATVEAEVPHSNLYQFRANLITTAPDGIDEKHPLGTKQLLLRGAKLRNTPRVLAVIVYNGRDSKLTLNQKNPPSKLSLIDRRVNKIVIVLVCFDALCAFVCGLGAGISQRVDMDNGRDLWYLGRLWEEPPSETGVFNFFSYFDLLSFMVPMSLMVTLEIVKFVQALFMEWDEQMQTTPGDKTTGMTAKTSGLNDQLGLVKYIFSDKTGTLTENKMEFSKCSVNGVRYDQPLQGQLVEVVESGSFKPGQAPSMERPELDAQVTEVVDFLTCLELCHAAVVERNEETGAFKFSAQSPDEIALCEAARRNKFTFLSRKSGLAVVEELGVERRYELLNVMEFTSERRRMSVIVRTPEGNIKMYSKGADSVMLQRLRENEDSDRLQRTQKHIDDFSKEGLRTLILAAKDLTEQQYNSWNVQYMAAATSIEGREEKVEITCDQLERDFRLIGCTAIEDKLQQGVPETIAYFLKAGIRVWVITGDKQETAINIGYSSRLLLPANPLVIVDGTDHDTVLKQIQQAIDTYCTDEPAEGLDLPGGTPDRPDIGLVVSGSALIFAIADFPQLFLKLAGRTSAVVCCRVTPLQKALVVQLVRRNLRTITLAIGDGANDVSMIQVAHIGVGIFGKEGTQAARASDYALQQFSHLRRLVVVHGRLSLVRNSLCIQMSLYKNMAFFFVQFWYAFYNRFSSQTIVDDWIVTMYNIVLTSVPPLFVGFFERDCSDTVIDRHPEVYKEVSDGSTFTMKTLARWLITALFHSVIFYWALVLLVTPGDSLYTDGRTVGLWGCAGIFATYGVLVTMSKMHLEINTWNGFTHGGLWLSLAAYFLLLGILSSMGPTWPQTFGVISVIFRLPSFYLVVAGVYICCLFPEFGIRYVQRQYFPNRWQLLQEQEDARPSLGNKSFSSLQEEEARK